MTVVADKAVARTYVRVNALMDSVHTTCSSASPLVASWLPGVERVDAHAIRYTARDMVEAARFSSFLGSYQADLRP